jgi:hypothetical protein
MPHPPTRFSRIPAKITPRRPTPHVASPHDHFFQLAFGDPEHAVPLLRTALPAPVASAIDWRTLARKDPTQRGRRGRRTLCDLLFTVRTTEHQDLLLYVVLEHKSQAQRFDALQILEQVTAVLRTHRREHPRDRYLPPVLPIVLHADIRPWQSPTDVRELFDLARIPPPLQRHLPSLPYVLDDLHDVPPAALRQRALSVFGLCALSALQYLPPAARDERAFAAFLDGWHDVQEQAARLGDAGGGRDLFDALVDYVYATSGLPLPVVQRQLTHRFRDPAMKSKFVSTAQQIRNEGRAEGKAATLLRQITRRFGAPAAGVVARLHAATGDDLDRWTDRILDATSLDDLFAE